MTRQVRLFCAWSVLFFFLFTLVSPDDALCFDTDTLVTAAIISGVTLGVALIVVLIVGTVRDTKRDRGEDDEDDDVWSQSPVLRTLGYRPVDDPLFGRSPVHPDGLADRQELEAFLEGKVDRVRFESRHRLAGVPKGFSLSPTRQPTGKGHRLLFHSGRQQTDQAESKVKPEGRRERLSLNGEETRARSQNESDPLYERRDGQQTHL